MTINFIIFDCFNRAHHGNQGLSAKKSPAFPSCIVNSSGNWYPGIQPNFQKNSHPFE
jgi:hypothetical protein